MKRLISIVTILFISSAFVQSQEIEYNSHFFESGIGAVFLGDGDVPGTALDFEYTWRFLPRFGLSSRLMFTTFTFEEKDFIRYDVGFANTFDLALKVIPFPKHFNRISANVGISYRHVSRSYGNSYKEYDSNGGYKEFGRLHNHPVYSNEKTIGFTSVLDVKIIKKDRFNFGSKATMHAFYTNGDIDWILSAYLGLEL